MKKIIITKLMAISSLVFLALLFAVPGTLFAAETMAESIDAPSGTEYSFSATNIAGQGAVLNSFGNILPQAGSSFVYITTGLVTENTDPSGSNDTDIGSDGNYDWVNFHLGTNSSLTIPANVEQILFDYYYITAENTSVYGDYFNVRLYGSTEVPDETLIKYVDPMNASSVGNALDGTAFAGLNGTGWKTVSVPAASGDVIRIWFYIKDATNGSIDSAVILDNFRFVYKQPAQPATEETEETEEKKPRVYEKTNSGFTIFYYNKILFREPTEKEVAIWKDRIEEGLTGADLVYSFIFGEECQNLISEYSNEEFVEFLYKAIFGRKPDISGYLGWLSIMEDGMAREDVVNNFTHSEEFIYFCSLFGVIPYEGYAQ